MTDIIVDGTCRVAFVTAIATLAAPTVAELNAGILLQTLLTPDGLVGFALTSGDVPTGSLASKFSPNRPGRDTATGAMLRLKKQLTGDTAYTALRSKNTTGFVVIRFWVAETTAWAAADQVEVWPIETGRRRVLPPVENEVAKYEIDVKFTAEPVLDAVVA